MDETELVEAVNEHADALRDGADRSEALLAAHPQRRGLLAELFALAARVREALRPVEPAPDFVADLRRQLAANGLRARTAARWEREAQQRRLAWAFGIGALVYLMGLAAISFRAAMGLVGMIGLILGWRQSAKRRVRSAV